MKMSIYVTLLLFVGAAIATAQEQYVVTNVFRDCQLIELYRKTAAGFFGPVTQSERPQHVPGIFR